MMHRQHHNILVNNLCNHVQGSSQVKIVGVGARRGGGGGAGETVTL